MSQGKPDRVEDRAFRIALSRLNRSAMSRSRLDAKLAAAGFEVEAVRSAALDRLERAGLLSDETYARALRNERLAAGDGPALVRQKLLQRGLEPTLIDRVLTEADDAPSPRDQARVWARRKLASLARLDPLTQRRRLTDALARRGHDPDTVESVVTDLLGNHDTFDAD